MTGLPDSEEEEEHMDFEDFSGTDTEDGDGEGGKFDLSDSEDDGPYILMVAPPDFSFQQDWFFVDENVIEALELAFCLGFFRLGAVDVVIGVISVILFSFDQSQFV